MLFNTSDNSIENIETGGKIMREDVLKIEFQPVFDKWAWKITYQNEDVLKRGIFVDEELCVESGKLPSFDLDILFLKGDFHEQDDEINLCTTEEKALIEEKVKAINEKYGIKKRWRGKQDEQYFYIDKHIGYICSRYEKGFEGDNFNYEIGNYFKTRELAEKYFVDFKKFRIKWHEENGADENEL